MTVIDYSSPRPRLKLRLPSRGGIVCRFEPGRFTAVEELRGKGGAVAGVVFAGLILGYFGTCGFLLGGWSGFFGAMVFMSPYAGLMVLVIDRTWRETLLSATSEELRLVHSSPLCRKEQHWGAGRVADVSSVATVDDQSSRPLGELRIQLCDGKEIWIFTGHRVEQIDDLAAAVRGALAGEV